MCVDLFVAEGDEGEDSIVECGICWRGGVFFRAGFPLRCDADFVAEFNDDAFGGFFTDAFDLGEGAGVVGSDGGFEGDG